MEWSETYSVKELVKIGVLERPIDGNHGSYHPTATDYVSKGIPFVMASDLKNGVIDYENCKFITHERAKKLQKGFAKKNDILLTHKATIGRTAIVKELSDSDFIMLTPQVTYYRVKDYNRLNNQFLRYYFESQKFQEILSQWAGAGSTRAYIGITNQLDLPIFIPPLSKQKRIAHILGSLDDKIELNRKMNETLEQMARALFKSWFVDFDPVHAKAAGKKPFGMDDATAALFPDSLEESELGLIPKGWRVGALGDLIVPVRKKIGIKKAVVLSAISSGDLIPSDEYFKKQVYSKSTHNYIAVEQWDFAYNPSRINIGSIGMLKSPIFGAVSPVYEVFKTQRPYEWYIEHLLSTERIKSTINVLCSGSVRQNLKIGDLAKICCIIPSQQTVARFNEIWSGFRSTINFHYEESKQIVKTRDLLLPQLLSDPSEVLQ